MSEAPTPTTSEPDYAWLIPASPLLHRLYRAAERHPWVYGMTWPLWAARYRWLRARWQG